MNSKYEFHFKVIESDGYNDAIQGKEVDKSIEGMTRELKKDQAIRHRKLVQEMVNRYKTGYLKGQKARQGIH